MRLHHMMEKAIRAEGFVGMRGISLDISMYNGTNVSMGTWVWSTNINLIASATVQNTCEKTYKQIIAETVVILKADYATRRSNFETTKS